VTLPTAVAAVNQAFVLWSKTPVAGDGDWSADDPVVGDVRRDVARGGHLDAVQAGLQLEVEKAVGPGGLGEGSRLDARPGDGLPGKDVHDSPPEAGGTYRRVRRRCRPDGHGDDALSRQRLSDVGPRLVRSPQRQSHGNSALERALNEPPAADSESQPAQQLACVLSCACVPTKHSVTREDCQLLWCPPPRGARLLFACPAIDAIIGVLQDEIVTTTQEIPKEWMALDIGPATTTLFGEALQNAKTIIWNGPMGVFEMDAFSRGTYATVSHVANSYALTIVGGGDTDVAIHRAGEYAKISYISTGGGAFLELLEGKELPGIVALTDKT